MWAQLSDPPPSLTGTRPDLPAAVDGVMAKALAKAPDDRYGTCLEFATALRQACGIRTGSTAPGKIVPGPGATRAVRPDELAAAGGAAAASAPGGQPPGPPAATGRAGPSVPDAGVAEQRRGRHRRDPHRHGPGRARRAQRRRAGPAAASPPRRAASRGCGRPSRA